jgi:SET domain-containing protein
MWTEFTFILQPSVLGGIGVFATHNIPINTKLFSDTFTLRTMKSANIPEAFKKYIIYLNDEECLCPERFDRMEIGWYINHSYQPNIQKNSDKHVVALRNINQGEEILIDYNCLNEPEHLKEDYYKR